MASRASMKEHTSVCRLSARLLFVQFFLFSCLVLAFGQSDPGYGGPWRPQLEGVDGACWTESVAACNRALVIVHGGDWNVQYPYDSMPAFQRGFDNQADAVKGDFRVNKEKTGMVMHSSPVEVYESPGCWGKKVEEMTTAECEQCKMEITSYTFISAPELLSWAAGKVNVMFCVKLDSDIPRAISTLIEANATHRAFLEIGVGAFLNTVTNKVLGWDQVFYIVEVGSSADIQALHSQPPEVLRRAFLAELNNWQSWPGPNSVPDDIAAVHKLGLRAVGPTDSDAWKATEKQHLALFQLGFDVVYSWNLANAVAARVQINTQRGLPSP